MRHFRSLYLILGLCFMIFANPAFAQQKTLKSLKEKRAAYEQDMKRRKDLQKSAEVWFAKNVLPDFRSSLSSIDNVSVTLTEQFSGLPANLGGPLKMVEVVLEGRVSGWSTGYSQRHGRFSDFPPSGPAQCRYKQKLWAYIDSQGRPTRLMDNQRSTGVIACATGSFSKPGYHGQPEQFGWN